uniref:C2H2-type domain-containing protein n=1 Tax=Loa loa TaxID=7209 RepID=A0A1I7W5Q7_LOALO
MFEEPQTEPLDLTMSRVCGGRIEPPDGSIAETSGGQAELSETDHEDAERNAAPSTHTMNHANEKPFPCSECNMSFIWPSLLNMHKKIHTSECGMNFTHPWGLNTHKRIHTGRNRILVWNVGRISPSHRTSSPTITQQKCSVVSVKQSSVKLRLPPRRALPFFETELPLYQISNYASSNEICCGKLAVNVQYEKEPQTEPLDLTMSKMCGGRIEPPDASIVEASGRQADHEDARSLNIPIQEASREQTAVGDMPKKIWLMRKHSQNATQTGKKRLKCEISKKDFVAPPSTHTMNHANEKPFPCSECNMSFIWPSHLNRYDDSYR